MSGWGPKDYSCALNSLEESGATHFIVGGQAVNIWAEEFDDVPGVSDLAPFTSKDCDVWVDYSTFINITDVVPGTLVAATNPSQGQLGILKIRATNLVLDLLQSVFGIRMDEEKKAFKRSIVVDGSRVMDPTLLLKAKCYNFVHLDQQGRQDEKHLPILRLILPAYLFELTVRAAAGEISERHLIREYKFLLSFRKYSFVRDGLARLGCQLIDLMPASFPMDTLQSLPKFKRFTDSTHSRKSSCWG